MIYIVAIYLATAVVIFLGGVNKIARHIERHPRLQSDPKTRLYVALGVLLASILWPVWAWAEMKRMR